LEKGGTEREGERISRRGLGIFEPPAEGLADHKYRSARTKRKKQKKERLVRTKTEEEKRRATSVVVMWVSRSRIKLWGKKTPTASSWQHRRRTEEGTGDRTSKV